jgi:hypothetical protein
MARKNNLFHFSTTLLFFGVSLIPVGGYEAWRQEVDSYEQSDIYSNRQDDLEESYQPYWGPNPLRFQPYTA